MQARIFARSLLPLAIAGSLLHAQSRHHEARRAALLEQAVQARTAGDHARALELANEAAQIHFSTSLRLFIAGEHAALAGTSREPTHAREAFDMALRCVQEATDDRRLPDRDRILRVCSDLVATWNPQHADAGVEQPRPTVPAVDASVSPPQDAALAQPPAPMTHDAGMPSPVLPTHSSLPPVPAPPPDHGPGAGPWVVVGAGGALLVLSGVFFALQSSANDTRHSYCNHSDAEQRDICPSDADSVLAYDAVKQERLFDALAFTSLGVGLAAVAGGIVWYATARHTPHLPPRTALRWSLTPVVGGAVWGLQGHW